MFDEQNNVFDVPHSLPSNSHMTALGSRTPAGPSKVESNKYMPDYGGILEVPGIKTKQSGLRVGIPFDTNPYYVRIESDSEQFKSVEPRARDCLIATPYLNTDGDDDLYRSDNSFSTLRAVGKTLYLDLVTSIPCRPMAPELHHFTTYGHVPYSYKILGLKYCDIIDNYVIVKFAQGIKLIKLNSYYKIPPKVKFVENDHESDSETEMDDCDEISMANQSAVNSIDSFAESQGLEVKDASLSRSQRWLYMASSDCKDLYVKLFDLSTSKQCHNVITKARDDDVKISIEESKKLNTDRRRSLRSFIPSKPSFEELQQITCDPNHLVNSMMITSNRVALIDPREKTISMNYADRFRILSISPTERFRQIEFSHFNDQQFYLMSDERLRAIDKRFPSKDMNILNHMIDSINYDVMTMRLTATEETEHEILCLSAYGHVCIFSFDQSQYSHSLVTSPGNLINPRSMHNPIHEPSPTTISGRPTDELYGLAVGSNRIFESKGVLFSTLQLSQEGDVCVRGFLCPRDDFLNFEVGSSTRNTEQVVKKCSSPMSDYDGSGSNESRVQTPEDDGNRLNILDAGCILKAQEHLTTKRAITKYESMRKKLCRR